jgi:hypothetical protein
MKNDESNPPSDEPRSTIPQFVKSIHVATPGTPDDLQDKEALPPMDSWIALDPGSELEFDAKVQQQWLNQARRFRRVRGTFLAACFDLEYTIDSIVAEALFPQPRSESREETKRAFEKLFLKSPTRTFGRKIAMLEQLSGKMAILSASVSKELIGELKDIVKIRNGFAHFPIVFKPIKSDTGQTLIPLLALKHPPLALDDSFFETYNKLIPKVAMGLDTVLQSFIVPPTEAPKPKEANTGTVYFGHSILKISENSWTLE